MRCPRRQDTARGGTCRIWRFALMPALDNAGAIESAGQLPDGFPPSGGLRCRLRTEPALALEPADPRPRVGVLAREVVDPFTSARANVAFDVAPGQRGPKLKTDDGRERQTAKKER